MVETGWDPTPTLPRPSHWACAALPPDVTAGSSPGKPGCRHFRRPPAKNLEFGGASGERRFPGFVDSFFPVTFRGSSASRHPACSSRKHPGPCRSPGGLFSRLPYSVKPRSQKGARSVWDRRVGHVCAVPPGNAKAPLGRGPACRVWTELRVQRDGS